MTSFLIILFQFADVDILQSILDSWSHMLTPLCVVCMTVLAPECILPSKLIQD